MASISRLRKKFDTRLRPRDYRLSISVFGRNSRFTFGGTYGFGRMCYITFGLLSVSVEGKTSAFGRPLIITVVDLILCTTLSVPVFVGHLQVPQIAHADSLLISEITDEILSKLGVRYSAE